MNIPCLVINLDRQQERFEIIKKELNDVGFSNVVRIPGVDGKKLPDTGLLPRSLVGCFESHKKCARYMVDNDIPLALILEDDAFPYPEKFPHDFTENVNDYDIVTYHTHDPSTEKKEHNLLMTSSAAYAMTYTGALKILNTKIFFHYDIQTNFEIKKFKSKQLFYTDESESTNVSDGKKNFFSENILKCFEKHRSDTTLKTVVLRNPISGYEYNNSELITIVFVIIMFFWFVNLF